MTEIQFKEKFIAFIDLLGFKNMVKDAESGTGMPLEKLLQVLETLGAAEHRDRLSAHGPSLCPQTKYVERDLDFRVTQVSDCVVISAEISPSGAANLTWICWAIVMGLLRSGIMCRGYITRGLIFHTDRQIIGSGYQKAFDSERNVTAFKREADERGTPFVEIDREVCEYVKQSDDGCIKKMFGRFVKDDGEVVALFPFKKLSHSFMITSSPGHKFDPEEERRNVQNMRVTIGKIKERVLSFVDPANQDAVKKSQHYIRALDDQLVVCDETDEVLTKLAAPFPARP